MHPSSTPAWKKQQINRLLVQDFVIYAHTIGDGQKAARQRAMLVNGLYGLGRGDWESHSVQVLTRVAVTLSNTY